jgi:hypothetical protein
MLTTRFSSRGASVRRAAEAGSGGEPQAAASPPATSSAPAEPSSTVDVKKVDANAPILQKGQGTAIVTGAISAILGIGYLVLVWMLDSRGGQMLPPPPEALIP